MGNVGTGFDQKTLADIRAAPGAADRPKQPVRGAPEDSRTRHDLGEAGAGVQVKFCELDAGQPAARAGVSGIADDVDPKEVRGKRPSVTARRKHPCEPGRCGNATPWQRKQEEMTVEIDGHSLKFTNLKKVFYPDEGYTKRDVLNYYDAVADLILPHLKDRPLSLKRYPNGIKEEFFFQKDTTGELPAVAAHRDASTIATPASKPIRYVFAEDRASLLYLVNLGCIDHNPWMSRVAHLDNPDFVLIDLDPQECPFDMIVEAALMVTEDARRARPGGISQDDRRRRHACLYPARAGLFLRGGRQFAKVLQMLVMHERPEMFTTPRAVSKRKKNRVYFDADRSANRRRSPRLMSCAHTTARRWRRRSNGTR